jgi:hypothetical protein
MRAYFGTIPYRGDFVRVFLKKTALSSCSVEDLVGETGRFKKGETLEFISKHNCGCSVQPPIKPNTPLTTSSFDENQPGPQAPPCRIIGPTESLPVPSLVAIRMCTGISNAHPGFIFKVYAPAEAGTSATNFSAHS